VKGKSTVINPFLGAGTVAFLDPQLLAVKTKSTVRGTVVRLG